MTEADAQRFALEWVESWNSHDLERILSHYSEDVEVTSPLIETVLGPGRISIGAECMEFNGAGAVRRVLAHYALGADPVAA